MAGLWPAGWQAPEAPPEASAKPLILTAALPHALQAQADTLRAARAPGAAARAPSHLTLFRLLPGLAQAELLRDVARACAAAAPRAALHPPERWDSLWVAPADAPALDALRADLAERWHGLLMPGDRARPRLHVSLGPGPRPPLLAAGPWRLPGLLLWQHRASPCDGAFWTPLVACRFHG